MPSKMTNSMKRAASNADEAVWAAELAQPKPTIEMLALAQANAAKAEAKAKRKEIWQANKDERKERRRAKARRN